MRSKPKRFSWIWLTEQRQPMAVANVPTFDSRYDAEQWLGEHWRRCVAVGAEAAQLLCEGRSQGDAVVLHSLIDRLAPSLEADGAG